MGVLIDACHDYGARECRRRAAGEQPGMATLAGGDTDRNSELSTEQASTSGRERAENRRYVMKS